MALEWSQINIHAIILSSVSWEYIHSVEYNEPTIQTFIHNMTAQPQPSLHIVPKSPTLAKYVCNSMHHWINNPIPTSMNIIGNVYWKVTRIKNRYVWQGKRILSFGLQKLKNIMGEESEGVTVGSCYILDATQPIYPNCLWIIDIFITFTNN